MCLNRGSGVGASDPKTKGLVNTKPRRPQSHAHATNYTNVSMSNPKNANNNYSTLF